MLSTIITWSLILLSLYFGGIGALNIEAKISSRNWITTSGTIISSDIYERNGRTHDWCSTIGYSYVVDGHIYTSVNNTSAIASSLGCDADRRKIEDDLDTMPIGGEIVVHYSPSQPSHAALKIEPLTWRDFYNVMLAAAMLGIVIFSFFRK